MSVRIINADVLDGLAMLPDESVQCCITSPPYWGLRDYGTATWLGGSSSCDHVASELRTGLGMEALGAKYSGGGKKAARADKIQFRDECGKCGATRVDQQIGLEPTPDAFVAKMVEVFREVKRVLRKDGTLWLNLGSSYASGGKRPIQSPQPLHAHPYGTDGTERLGSHAPGCACHGPDDELPNGSENRHGRIPHIAQPLGKASSRRGRKDHDTGHLDFAEASLAVSDPAAPSSKVRASFRRDRAVVSPLSAASAFPPSIGTSVNGAPLSGDMSACTCGTAPQSGASAQNMLGRLYSGSACGDPDCEGCGICWAYLAIPLLRFKSKDLISIPHFLAFALQADGWTLRQEIIWSKPNPMPESVRDRCTKSHEHIFLLTKSERYHFDAAAIAEAGSASQDRPQQRRARELATEHGLTDAHLDALRACGVSDAGKAKVTQNGYGKNTAEMQRLAGEAKTALGGYTREFLMGETRNKRSVWTVATTPYSEAHFATFPEELPETCIKAGCPVGGTILDPFGGAGTTGLVADKLGRNAVLIELNPEYAEMAEKRIRNSAPLFADLEASRPETPEQMSLV